MKVLNAYESIGSMVDENDKTKKIEWDNYVIEGIVTDSYFSWEKPIFGGKFTKVKINKEIYQSLCNKPITELMGKDVEFLYNNNQKLVQIIFLQNTKVS